MKLENYAVHTNSSSSILQGNKNIFFGVRAGYHHVGYNNIAIGYHAGSGEASDWGSETHNNYNISIGAYALSNYTGHKQYRLGVESCIWWPIYEIYKRWNC